MHKVQMAFFFVFSRLYCPLYAKSFLNRLILWLFEQMLYGFDTIIGLMTSCDLLYCVMG